MLMQFGQFLDHDLTLTPEAEVEGGCCRVNEEVLDNEDCLAIPVGPGDFFATEEGIDCLEFRLW